MKKALNAIRIGAKLAVGITAGYFVLKATDKKADELVEDGGIVNAAVICVGRSALAAVTGTVVYHLYLG